MTDPGAQTNTQGAPVSLQIQATDADGLPLDYSADDLPAGLTLNTQTGAITGTISPNAAGFYVATVTASDADDYSASQTFAWSVAPAVTVTDPGRQSSTEGAVVSLQIQTTDALGTPTFTAANLPGDFSISSSGKITGTISAGAAAKGPYQVTITATDGAYSASQTFVWSVAPAVTITDPGPQFNLESGVVSLQIQATDSTGGTPTFTADNLPAGLQISSSGKITGTVSTGAAAKGPYQVTITATDGSYSASQTVQWAVAAGPAGTWSGDTAVLDAAFAALGAQGRAVFDDVVEQTGQQGGSSSVLVRLGRPALGLLASYIIMADGPVVPAPPYGGGLGMQPPNYYGNGTGNGPSGVPPGHQSFPPFGQGSGGGFGAPPPGGIPGGGYGALGGPVGGSDSGGAEVAARTAAAAAARAAEEKRADQALKEANRKQKLMDLVKYPTRLPGAAGLLQAQLARGMSDMELEAVLKEIEERAKQTVPGDGPPGQTMSPQEVLRRVEDLRQVLNNSPKVDRLGLLDALGLLSASLPSRQQLARMLAAAAAEQLASGPQIAAAPGTPQWNQYQNDREKAYYDALQAHNNWSNAQTGWHMLWDRAVDGFRPGGSAEELLFALGAFAPHAGPDAKELIRSELVERGLQELLNKEEELARGESAIPPEGPGGLLAGPRLGQAGLAGRIPLEVLGQRSCFTAGTPLLTPDGEKLIEQFREGDWLLSRSEHDPEGTVEARRVVQVFVRTALVLELRVGGRLIRTTAEHPFWVVGRGWAAAGTLRPGDWLLSHDGRAALVEGATALRETATVYNLEVEEHHTYFVGRGRGASRSGRTTPSTASRMTEMTLRSSTARGWCCSGTRSKNRQRIGPMS